MAGKGEQTRERILAAAESLILERGYAGMSIDELLRHTDLAKGAFFHHFKSKADLASAVLERYAANDLALFLDFSERADRLSDDPLERVIIFLRLFEEFLDDLGKPFPGCIFAAYTYSRDQFGPDAHSFIARSLDRWRALYEEKLDALIAVRKPRADVTARQLSELIASIIEGGIIIAKAKDDAEWTQRQSKEFQRYLRFLFGEE